MSILKMYFAATDTLVSQAPTETDAITFDLRVDLEEYEELLLYAKCDAGYKATNVTIKGAGTVPAGTSVARWEIATATGPGGTHGTYVAASTGLDYVEVTTDPTFFRVKATSLDTEPHGKDNTVTIELKGTKVTL